MSRHVVLLFLLPRRRFLLSSLLVHLHNGDIEHAVIAC